MKKLLLVFSVGFCLAVSAATTSCIVSGYEENLTRPLTGTYAEKTCDLSGRIEGRMWCADVSSAGLFDSLVRVSRDSEAGPLCSLRLGFLLFLQ